MQSRMGRELSLHELRELNMAKSNYIKKRNRTQHGFTIVELLIVIVIIGILAAITIVAYNGIQSRANASGAMSDIQSLDKAIKLYYADNGSYPVTSGWSGLGREANFIPGLAPKYIAQIPQSRMTVNPGVTTDTVAGWVAAYAYQSNGTDYKLMAHNDSLCNIVKKIQAGLMDVNRNCWAYGYWTPGAINW